MLFDESLTLVADTLWRIPPEDIEGVVEDLFTPNEITEIAERIKLMRKLKAGETQRKVAEDLGISVTTVSRGARVLKYGRGIIEKYL